MSMDDRSALAEVERLQGERDQLQAALDYLADGNVSAVNRLIELRKRKYEVYRKKYGRSMAVFLVYQSSL